MEWGNNTLLAGSGNSSYASVLNSSLNFSTLDLQGSNPTHGQQFIIFLLHIVKVGREGLRVSINFSVVISTNFTSDTHVDVDSSQVVFENRLLTEAT